MTTIAKTFRTLVFMTVSGAIAALASGCAADATGAESASQTEEAMLPVGSGHTVTTYTCGSPTSLKSTDVFEKALSDLQCGQKTAYAKSGVGAWFDTTCPTTTTATFACPHLGSYGSTTPTITSTVQDLLWCYAGVAPYAPATLQQDSCTGLTSEGGQVVIGWDPNCSGSGCPVKVVIQ